MANGNRIKIRHGTGTPTTDNLLSYELGWNGEALFINNNGSIKKLFGDSQSFIDLSVGNLVVTGSASFTNIPTVNGTTIALTTNIPTATNTIPIGNGTATVGVELSYARGDHIHPTDITRAPLNSPELTGTPTAPTATLGTSTTQIATTAFVSNTTAKYLPLTGGILTGQVTTTFGGTGINWAGFKVIHGSSNKGCGFEANRTDNGLYVQFGISTDGINHGIYSNGYIDSNSVFQSDTCWMISRDSNGNIVMPNLSIDGREPIGTVQDAIINNDSVTVNNESSTAVCQVSLNKGKWLLIGHIRFASNSTGRRVANISTTQGSSADHVSIAAASGITGLEIIEVVRPTSTTTYYLNAWQNSGSNLAIKNSTSSPNVYISGLRAISIG